ncbi:hypothetical protein [Streptosporangium longisporum]|uniref:Uncharacterized protein n=1 Tax=Streptosporangium longisporum TaxID=46187 RepID=A0ABP6KQT9_9ACTN
MYVATVTLTATDAAARRQIASPLVTDILWAAAVPADDLEHLHSRAVPERIDLTFFHRSPDPERADAAAVRICRRALDTSPALRGWVLHR